MTILIDGDNATTVNHCNDVSIMKIIDIFATVEQIDSKRIDRLYLSTKRDDLSQGVFALVYRLQRTHATEAFNISVVRVSSYV